MSTLGWFLYALAAVFTLVFMLAVAKNEKPLPWHALARASIYAAVWPVSATALIAYSLGYAVKKHHERSEEQS